MGSEWVSAIAGIVGASTALYAAIVGLKTFRHQQTTNDVSLALAIFEQINRYWDRADEKIGSQAYNFGQALAYFEVASGLFNDGILTNQASKILKDHIVEVFTSFHVSVSGKRLLDHCQSSGTTFSELRKFADQHFSKALLAQAFADDKVKIEVHHDK